MKNKYNKLTCLFGHHDYSKRLTKDKDGRSTHLCKICKRSGYEKWDDGEEVWTDYDGKGNCIHTKWDDKLEVWHGYDEEGNLVCERWDNGEEYWLGDNENWLDKKPKNWKYEKQIQ